MKINEQLEKEIATRLNLTKPVAPADVSAYIADGELLNEAISNYNPPRPSWRASREQVRGVITDTRQMLEILETHIDKVESYGETIALATTAHLQALADYWKAIDREESKPRDAFKQAREEFVSAMEKEKRSLKRKQNKTDWQTEEYQAITTRLELVEYLASEARYLDYDPETAPEFNEQVLWLKVAQAQYRADKFLEFVKTQTENA